MWLGESLIPLQNIPPFAISILLCLLVAMFTECSSNTATTTLFLPILASMVRHHALIFSLCVQVKQTKYNVLITELQRRAGIAVPPFFQALC